MRTNASQARQGDMVTVSLDADGAGSKSAGFRSSTFAPPHGELHATAGAASLLGVLPVLERASLTWGRVQGISVRLEHDV